MVTVLGNTPRSGQEQGGSGPVWVVDAFEQALRARGVADKTRTVYCQTARSYCAAVNPLEVTAPEIEAWLAQLGVGRNTLGQYQVRVRQLHRWLQRTGYRVDDPTVLLERPRPVRLAPRPLPMTVCQAIWELGTVRERAWIALGLYCGLRAGEAVRVAVEDLVMPGRLRVVGKGNRVRVVPVRSEVVDALEAVGWPAAGRFFPRAGEKAASTAIGRLLREVGAPGWASYHCLRHTYGTLLYASTKDLRLVQEMLGHASIATTQGYVAVDDGAAVRAVDSLPTLVTPSNTYPAPPNVPTCV